VVIPTVKHRKESIGRMAVFFLPTHLLGKTLSNEQRCADFVTSFIEQTYGGCTVEGSDHAGFWLNDAGKEFRGLYTKYRVSFRGRDRIAELDNFLAFIGKELNQESIYLETGEDSFLIYPE